MFLRYNEILRAPDGGEGGGDPTPAATQPTVKTLFSLDYVQELREENKAWRLKAQGFEASSRTYAETADKATNDAAAAIKEAAEKAERTAGERITAAEAAANARIIRADLRTAAVKAGMVDLDGLKMLDASKLKINADGDVEGADALLEEAKKSKPYLFGGGSSSSTAQTPPAKAASGKPALDMTDAQFNDAKKNRSWR